jgi:pyruvate carboxylase subunit B
MGKQCWGHLAYTTSPVHTGGFVKRSKEAMEALGCDSLQDMAGSRRQAATGSELVAANPSNSLPVFIHSHDCAQPPCSAQAMLMA